MVTNNVCSFESKCTQIWKNDWVLIIFCCLFSAQQGKNNYNVEHIITRARAGTWTVSSTTASTSTIRARIRELDAYGDYPWCESITDLEPRLNNFGTTFSEYQALISQQLNALKTSTFEEVRDRAPCRLKVKQTVESPLSDTMNFDSFLQMVAENASDGICQYAYSADIDLSACDETDIEYLTTADSIMAREWCKMNDYHCCYREEAVTFHYTSCIQDHSCAFPENTNSHLSIGTESCNSSSSCQAFSELTLGTRVVPMFALVLERRVALRDRSVTTVAGG